MPDIRHRVGINAPIDTVYESLATRDGLAGWWTRDVDGEPSRGASLAFSFGGPEPAAVMEVTELDPPARVRWKCTDGPPEWRNTMLTFEVKEAGDETAVLFTHAGWREPAEFMHHCSTKWAYYLIGLKAGLEGGKSTPWPEDAPISSWG